MVGGGGQIFKTITGGIFTGIETASNEIPKEFILHQSYPNPFNNQTVIEFEIIEKINYKMEIYDILGRKIK